MNARRLIPRFRGLVILWLALSPRGFAAGPTDAGSAGRELQMMDANRDGKISADEHAAGARAMFEMMDANKDGNVTAAEMDAAHEQVTGRKAKGTEMSSAEKIKVIDTDGDGSVSAEEHAGGSKTMFEEDGRERGRLPHRGRAGRRPPEDAAQGRQMSA
jgi:hypothetical protein